VCHCVLVLAFFNFNERHALTIDLHQNGLTCREIAAILHLKKNIYQIIKFNCRKEGFRTSQTVQQVNCPEKSDTVSQSGSISAQ